MSEPSKTHGYTESGIGALKENVGYAFGNERLETEGKIRREKGNAEIEAAREKERLKGAGETVVGKTKKNVGGVIGDSQMQAEGMQEEKQGKIRRESNQ